MPDEVIFHGSIEHVLDHKAIEKHIIIAEERFIRPALGFELYQYFAASKNLRITTANKTVMQATIQEYAPGEDITLEVGMIINASEFLSRPMLQLWDDILCKFCAEAVMLMSIPDNYVKLASAGVIHSQPTSSTLSGASVVTPSLSAVKWAMDQKMNDVINPFTGVLHEYICHNISLFPQYAKPCHCEPDGAIMQEVKKTQFVMGVYDDEPKNCCNGWDQLGPLS